MSIYRKLANQFIDEIETGKRPEGGRMPSLRQLAKQQAISMSTVVSCYQELESQGWFILDRKRAILSRLTSLFIQRLSGHSLKVRFPELDKLHRLTILSMGL